MEKLGRGYCKTRFGKAILGVSSSAACGAAVAIVCGLPSEMRFIISNTTEAGIVYDETDDFNAEPPKTYPGKLTKFLYTRFKAFDGA